MYDIFIKIFLLLVNYNKKILLFFVFFWMHFVVWRLSKAYYYTFWLIDLILQIKINLVIN